MTNLEKTVEKFEKLLNNALGTDFKMSRNNGSFGISYYLYLNVNDKFISPIKIRLSDHSVESTQRIMNEVHISKDNEKMIEDVEYIERLFFPERFVEDKIVTGTKKIEWSKDLMHEINFDYKVIGQRVTKKGNVQMILDVDVFETIFNRK